MRLNPALRQFVSCVGSPVPPPELTRPLPRCSGCVSCENCRELTQLTQPLSYPTPKAEPMTPQTLEAPRALPGDILKPGVLTALSGEGTTPAMLALDMALAAAAGQAWFGYPTEPTPAVYLSRRSSDVLERQIAVWEAHHGIVTTNLRVLAKGTAGHLETLADFAALCRQSGAELIVIEHVGLSTSIPAALELQRLTHAAVVMAGPPGGVRCASGLLDVEMTVRKTRWRIARCRDTQCDTTTRHPYRINRSGVVLPARLSTGD